MKQLNLQKLQNNLRKKFLKVGVKMIGPETIFFSKDTKIGKNVIIEPYVAVSYTHLRAHETREDSVFPDRL